MLTVTKVFKFCYGHHLPEYAGKCRNFHGHNCTLEITVSGGPDNQLFDLTLYDGMVIDFGDLKRIVEKKIISKLDHEYINDIIPVPTAENMTMWIVEKLREVFRYNLIRVKFYETDDSYAEWTRE